MGGRLEYKDGGYYIGELVDLQPHGSGTLFDANDNERFAGDFRKGEKVMGIYTAHDGTKYEGKFEPIRHLIKDLPLNGVGGQRHNGTLMFGRYYMPNDFNQCILRIPGKRIMYTGSALNYLPSGFGYLAYHNDMVYKGQFLNGKRHGVGMNTSAVFSRSRKFYRTRSNASLNVFLEDNDDDLNEDVELVNGCGFRAGFTLDLRPRNVLEGKKQETEDVDDFCLVKSADDFIHLNAVETYCGEWEDDKRCGHGSMTRDDGASYHGEWKDNKRHGFGVTTYSDKRIEQGRYRYNKLIEVSHPSRFHRDSPFNQEIQKASLKAHSMSVKLSELEKTHSKEYSTAAARGAEGCTNQDRARDVAEKGRQMAYLYKDSDDVFVLDEVVPLALEANLYGISKIDQKKILVYQIAFGKSHIQFSGTLIDHLVSRGHIVDQLLFRYNYDVTGNGTNRHRKHYEITSSKSNYHLMSHIARPFSRQKTIDWDILAKNKLVFCEELLKNDRLIRELKDEKYDIMLTQPWDGCNLPLAHVLGIKATALYVATPSAHYVFENLGLQTPTAYFGDPFLSHPLYRTLNFWERLENFKHWIKLHIGEDRRNLEDVLFQKYFPGTPKYDELYRKISYVFVNANEFTDIGRPISNKVKFIGGIHLETMNKGSDRQLPIQYENILASSKKGTVIFSFGSLVMLENVPKKVKTAFLEAFKELKDYNFIWKYDNLTEAKTLQADNVYFKDWLPQKQLLKDPRIRCFISHMGMNSFTELAYAGVPVLMVPLFADQRNNAGAAMRKGIGLAIEKEDLTKKSILEALTQVLETPKFDENAKNLAKILKSATVKQSTGQRFVDAVEMAAEYPEIASLLALPSADYSIWVTNTFDVVVFLSVSATLIGIVNIYIVYKVIAFLLCFNVKSGEKPKVKKS
ncbi:unnamed protein product [Bursaphelenchus okinawaensis]|uniref:glucuronosyltransferase n=1 Tax=Bursaphelenchus okinawaensis TaxID=465554 RepID=A0A811K1Q6_9BILA|nr:unnamed protein product [Bursaphelenchus okinawaensis]CAG9088869.1 unnamed protein product [Bursaphelenchus okinawaensis]